MGCRFALPAITLAMVLGIGWTPTHASDQIQACSALSKIAETIMKARQNSVALETTIQIYSEEATPQAYKYCLLYTSPSPRDQRGSRMPSSA